MIIRAFCNLVERPDVTGLVSIGQLEGRRGKCPRRYGESRRRVVSQLWIRSATSDHPGPSVTLLLPKGHTDGLRVAAERYEMQRFVRQTGGSSRRDNS
jgi:hypothetical protein